MAERLKEEILNREKMVDILAGPDAYRDRPRLLAVAESGHGPNATLSLLTDQGQTPLQCYTRTCRRS